jgi:hypothetical protein
VGELLRPVEVVDHRSLAARSQLADLCSCHMLDVRDRRSYIRSFDQNQSSHQDPYLLFHLLGRAAVLAASRGPVVESPAHDYPHTWANPPVEQAKAQS